MTQSDSINTRLKALEQGLSPLKNLKITGYVQAGWQKAQTPGIKNYAGGDFGPNIDNRFMIRRGRIKFTFTDKNLQFVFQPDMTERAFALRDIYGAVTDPWTGKFTLTAGVFLRPFTFENLYGSNMRETPERAHFQQILTPNERDAGAMMTWKWRNIKVDGGFFNGNAIAGDSDSKKDFMGRASFTKSHNATQLSGGISIYAGGVRQTTNKVYVFVAKNSDHGAGMLLKDTAVQQQLGRYAHRRYFAADLQYTAGSPLGKITLRAEVITGLQPGTQNSNESAKTKDGLTGDLYVRSIHGGVFYYVQNLGHSHFQTVLKYDWFDPNAKVAAAEAGKPNSRLAAADLRYNTFGAGLNFIWKNLILTAYYDWVRNEKAPNLAGYEQDLKDNILTLRMQMRF